MSTKLSEIGYSLDDVSIVPSWISNIESRKAVLPYMLEYDKKYGGPFSGKKLPIFVAPMESVVDETNYKEFINNGVIPVISRSSSQRLTLSERISLSTETFVAISLSEANELVKWDTLGTDEKHFICVDIAQGAMLCLIYACSHLKRKFGDKIVIMTGNIANPGTYEEYCRAGIDFARVSIGSGSRCTTACATGVYVPAATLLDQIREARDQIKSRCPEQFTTNIIMDGGIDWYDKIPKSIALGADAVMIGKMFAECEEACGEIGYATSENGFMNDVYFTMEEWDNLKDCVPKYHKFKPYRMYRGMSHRSSQKMIGGDGSKVSEGICKPVTVKYKLSQLLENIEAYLRSAMSYTNSPTLDDMKENARLIILGGNGKMTYAK